MFKRGVVNQNGNLSTTSNFKKKIFRRQSRKNQIYKLSKLFLVSTETTKLKSRFLVSKLKP